MNLERAFRGTEMVVATFEAMNLPNEVIWASDFAREKLGIEAMKEYAGPLFTWNPGSEVVGQFGAREFHHRSFNIEIPTKDGEPPIHLNIKGGGLYDGDGVVQWIEIGGVQYGLISLEACFADMRNSLWLKSLGVRTAEPVAIIRLKALPIRGYGGHTNVVPVDALKASGKIENQEFIPAVLIRKVGSDTRLQDVLTKEGQNEREPNELLLKELPHVMSDLEHDLGEKINPKKYLEWVVETYGRNLGKMHAGMTRVEESAAGKDPSRKARVHKYVTPGNLTIRGEMIDNADFEEVNLPDMTKPVVFADMTEALAVAKQTEDTIELIKRDIGKDENEDGLGVWPVIFAYATTVLYTFPEAFKDDIDVWKDTEDARMNYYFEQLCPELDDAFWRAYLEEAPHLAFLHRGFRFPRQGEKSYFNE